MQTLVLSMCTMGLVICRVLGALVSTWSSMASLPGGGGYYPGIQCPGQIGAYRTWAPIMGWGCCLCELSVCLGAGKLFPGPHLYAGAAIVVLWATAASLVPAMTRGNDAARTAHITFNCMNILLFAWQVRPHLCRLHMCYTVPCGSPGGVYTMSMYASRTSVVLWVQVTA